MKATRIVAFACTFLFLGLGAASLLLPVEMTVTAGADSRSWSCGSAAFPDQLMDFGPERVDDATNCAGGTPASAALFAFVLAGVGLAVVALATWRLDRGPEREQVRSSSP